MVKHTENGTIREYTIIYGKIIEKQQVFTVVWTIVFVFTMVKLLNLFLVFFQSLPIVNWKVIFVIFQKKVLFFVFFFTFSICGRSQKNSFFFNFFRKTWKNFKVIFSKFMHFWHHMLRILTFFCTQNEVQGSYCCWDQFFWIFEKSSKKHCFLV